MRRAAGKSALVAVSAFLATVPLSAQWLKYPTANVPRTASGQPNLNAPTPRASDGKPDLSGLWEAEQTRPCPPAGCADLPAGERFLRSGLGTSGRSARTQPWAADLVKARREQNGKDDLISRCLPTGVPRMHAMPLLRKLVQVPGVLVILNEQNASFRQIFTDGRPLPDDLSHPGTATRQRSGTTDALVVQSNGFRDGIWLDRFGSPMTDAARVTERFRRVNFGKLEIEVTVDDPKAYIKPWTVKLNHFIALDTDLLDYFCLENEKDVPRLVGK